MAHLHRLILSVVLAAWSWSSFAVTCPELQATLTAEGVAWVNMNNTDRAACLDWAASAGAGMDQYCGSINPSYSIQTQFIDSVEHRRKVRYVTGPPSEGSIVSTYISPWISCGPVDCPVGKAVEAEGSVGWAAEGTTPMKGVPDPVCTDVGGKGCYMSFGGISIMTPGGPIVNGRREWFQSIEGTLTGGTCPIGSITPVSTPAPPCEGTQGTVNGISVCLAVETQAEKLLRAQDAAVAASAAAYAAAIAAGKSATEAASIAATAGEAAKNTILTGGSSTAAAGAGAAAANALIPAGASALAALAAGAAEAAKMTAIDAATAAGKTAAQIAAAGTAAGTAASVAIMAGGTPAVAAAAGSAAGSAAANGASPGAAAGAGAGAAAGVGAGDGEGEGEGTESKWAGSCGAPPACEGDAIFCAVAAQTLKTACALEATAAAAAPYEAAKGLTGNQTTNLPGNSTVAITSSSFDQTEFLGAAVGLTDLTITVMGRTAVIALSALNIWFSRLGMLLQAVTFLLCIRIVARG